MTLDKGSMREALNNIHKILREDETLLRLLFHPPQSEHTEHRYDPLDKSYADIIGSDEEWNIIDDYIFIGETNMDIEEKDKCRLYMRAGRRRSKFGNYMVADQELVITLYVPNDFQRRDMRLEWIGDRVNQLIVHEYISGMNKMRYVSGASRVAPHNYTCYEHVYQFMVGKK